MTETAPVDSRAATAVAQSAVTDQEVRDHIHKVVEESKTSFLWAMKLLKKPRREAMFAIYCYCREIDDVADDPAPPARKIAALAQWREEIEGLFAGHPRSLTARGLAGPVAAYGMAKEDFLALIDGMEMDAREDMRGPTMAELELYCDRVASAVGRLSVRAFGDHGPRARDVATALGRALQLTNILRDLAEDAERGRLYLPAELLDAHGIDSRDPKEVLGHPALPLVCRDLAGIAQSRFDEAEAALAECDRGAMRPAIVMKEVYRRYLDRLLAEGWRDPHRRVQLSKAQKIWIALRHGVF
ncbi:MAG: presqualene diphosphate synthase HpnD [Alphaproteobacteria bacterium]|nr:presqualene diphosphate synthase HpnD [Alphaproteobacteria bacterium]